MSHSLAPNRMQECEIDVMSDSEDDESVVLTAQQSSDSEGGVASMSMADINIHHRQSRTRATSSRRRLAKKCICLLTVSVFIAALTTYLLQDRIDVLDNPLLDWLGLHPAWVLETSDDLSEYGSDLLVYRHVKTDAKLAALIPKQPTPGEDKAFGIGFRTKPTSSNGVAHILEHSVLCGSKKYMAKDPFVYLLKGSLHTFLNAFTYPDRTLYPVASRNRQDFLNLIDVYLDAVFNPRCVTEEGWWVLKQEGWRYVDEGDGLEVRGVVHSEMLGAYSDPDEVLYQTSQSLIFPDSAYFWDSGGAPLEISSLTREEYVSFYNRHYHPTNSKTFVTGDSNDVADVLHILDGYLKNYEFDGAIRDESRIPYQVKKFDEPVRASKPYPSGEDDTDEDDSGGGRNLLITWLINDDTHQLSAVEELALIVLDDMMLGSSSSVLEKALMDSGLGDETFSDGIDRTLIQMVFQVGMKGIKDEEGVLQVEEVIMKTLFSLADDGFDGDDIKASLNSIEFALRDYSGGNEPKGIGLYTRVMNKWNYDIHPIEALAFEDTLSQLKDIVAETGSDIFQNLIKDYLLNNSHRTILDLYPDPNMEAEQLKEEKKHLADVQKRFKPQELQDVLDESKSLEKIQSADDPPDAVAAIPSLSLSDLDRNEVEFPIFIEEDVFGSDATLVSHIVPSSSGIAYIDFGFDISNIQYEDIPLLPFLQRMMMETGTKNLTDIELDRLIGMHTGGIGVDRIIETITPDGAIDRVVSSSTKLRTMLFIQGKCMADKARKMFPMMFDILTSTNLDSPKKATQILRETISAIESNIQSDGDDYATRRIMAKFSVPGFLGEQWSGSAQLAVVKDLLDSANNNWPAVVERLERMRQAIIGTSLEGVIINFSGDDEVLSTVKDPLKKFVTRQLSLLHKSVPDEGKGKLLNFKTVNHPWALPAQESMKATMSVDEYEAILASTKVSYVGKGGPLFQLNEPVSGSMSVVSRYLQNGYLWDTIRVQMGAYGAMAYLYSTEGILIFMSYRDPNLSTTLAAYDGAAPQLLEDASSTLSAQDSVDLTRAIIGAIGHHDGRAPSTAEIGWISLLRWLRNESPEMRQRYRDQIIETTAKDFDDFANRLTSWSPTICAVTSQSMLDEMNADADAPKLKTILSV